MTPKTVDAQRADVEERAAPERREPVAFGIADSVVLNISTPEGHPYHWPVIGYMDDLTAASYDDVVAFFQIYHAPGNASLVVAGDIDSASLARSSRSGSTTSSLAPVTPMTIPGTHERSEDDLRTAYIIRPRSACIWLATGIPASGDASLDIVRTCSQAAELASLQAPRLRHAD